MEINFLPNIFSFSGRKQSGKTELTKICKEYGYEILNFADPMKNMICQLLKITREELEEKKDIQQYIKFSEDNLEFLSIETDIDIEIYKEKKEFNSIREIMQYIGTDIIRKYNSEWHISKINEIILCSNNVNKKYCFGDTRFKNEKLFLESLGAECWFIIRPNNFNLSNHISEVELSWYNFNRNILINENLKNTILKWKKYINLHRIENINLKNKILKENNLKIIRNKMIYLLNNFDINSIVYNTKLRKTQILWLCNKLLIHYFNEYNEYIFKNLNVQNAYLFGQLETNGYIIKNKDKCYIVFEHENKNIVNNFKKTLNLKGKILKFEKNKNFYIKFKNGIIIENLKKWGLENLRIYDKCIN